MDMHQHDPRRTMQRHSNLNRTSKLSRFRDKSMNLEHQRVQGHPAENNVDHVMKVNASKRNILEKQRKLEELKKPYQQKLNYKHSLRVDSKPNFKPVPQ